jgi:hypothetical protein
MDFLARLWGDGKPFGGAATPPAWHRVWTRMHLSKMRDFGGRRPYQSFIPVAVNSPGMLLHAMTARAGTPSR